MTVEFLSFHSLYGDGLQLNAELPVQELIESAEVVYALDVMTRYPHLIFGRDVVTDVATGERKDFPQTLYVELDQGTNELPILVATVQAIKGHHEYVRPSGHPVRP